MSSKSKLFNLGSTKYFYVLLFLIGCVTLTISCGSESEVSKGTTGVVQVAATATKVPTNTASVTSKPLPPQDWKNRWLKGIPCKAPCFEGITPGSSSVTETIKLLEQSPLVARTNVYIFDSKAEYGVVGWDWVDGTSSPTGQVGTGGSASYKTQIPNQTVQSMTARIGPYRLDEIIKAYGEPTHVAATYTLMPEKASFYYHVAIIYSLQGFTVSTRVANLPVVNGDLLLEQVTFSIPGIENFVVSYPVEVEKKYTVPWQGFKDFGFYCRNFRGEDCNKYLKP